MLFSYASSPPKVGSCEVFPQNNIWNTPVDFLPIHPDSNNTIHGINSRYFNPEKNSYQYFSIRPNFGSGTWKGAPKGIPITRVTDENAPYVDIDITYYKDQSDVVQVPIPFNALIEGGSNYNHVIIFNEPTCSVYELSYAKRPASPDLLWSAAACAFFDLGSNKLRKDTWISADGAGLPILPGLARYEEIEKGEINHALRFTLEYTRGFGYLWPARHYSSSATDKQFPLLGSRFRLKEDFDIDGQGFGKQTKIILRALKKYGLILADNGQSWDISGEPNPGWDDDQLTRDFQFSGKILTKHFEMVDVSSLLIDKDSGETKPQPPTTPRPSKSPQTPLPTRKPTKRPKYTTPYPTRPPLTPCQKACSKAKKLAACLAITVPCTCVFIKNKCVPS